MGRTVTGVVVWATVSTLAVAGCAGESEPIEWPDDPTPPETSTQSPQPSSDAAEAQAAEEIVTLVREYRDVEAASYADPQPPYLAKPELTPYLADPLLSETLDTLRDMDEAGIVSEGRPTSEPAVSELHLDETPPTAVVRDCIDTTDWRQVFRDTGDPVPGDELPDRYVMEVHAKLYPDGWLLHDAYIQGGSEC